MIKNGEIANAEEVIGSIGNIASQSAYEQVKADSTNWTNTDYLGADIFTVAAGAKSTIDTTSSTGKYNSTSYAYALNFTDEASGDTTHDPDSVTNINNAFDGNDTTYADKTSTGNIEVGKIFATARYIGWVKIKATGTIRDTAGGTSSGSVTIKLQSYNGSTWSDVATLSSNSQSSTTAPWGPISTSYNSNYFLNASVTGLRILINSGGDGGGMVGTNLFYTLEYGDFNTSSTVETNTIINEAVPDSIVIYGKITLPTGTSITCDISDDGGSTWALTNQNLNSYIDTSSFSTGNLAIKFNLATTDPEETPLFYGYGVAITDY